MNEFEQTIRHIESIETEWRYVLSKTQDAAHSFGRVPEDGRVVALWSVPRTTAEYLEFMTRLIQAKTILELGCSAGYSTLFLAKATNEINGTVYTTEILPEKIDLAKKHFAQAKLSDTICLLEEDIKEVIIGWSEGEIDLVFMDADKQRYEEYLEGILPLLAENGLIIVDNAGTVAMPDGRCVKSEHIERFRETVRTDERLRSTYLDFDNGILLIQRK